MESPCTRTTSRVARESSLEQLNVKAITGEVARTSPGSQGGAKEKKKAGSSAQKKPYGATMLREGDEQLLIAPVITDIKTIVLPLHRVRTPCTLRGTKREIRGSR